MLDNQPQPRFPLRKLRPPAPAAEIRSLSIPFRVRLREHARLPLLVLLFVRESVPVPVALIPVPVPEAVSPVLARRGRGRGRKASWMRAICNAGVGFSLSFAYPSDCSSPFLLGLLVFRLGCCCSCWPALERRGGRGSEGGKERESERESNTSEAG